MYRYKVGIQANCTKYYIITSNIPLEKQDAIDIAIELEGNAEVPDEVDYHNDTHTEVEEIK